MRTLFLLMVLALPLGGCALAAAGIGGAIIEHDLTQPGYCVDVTGHVFPCPQPYYYPY